MKFFCLFITTLTGFSSVVFTSHIHTLDSGDSTTTPIAREVSNERQQRYKCFEGFTHQADAFLAEAKHKSILCEKATENDNNDFDLRNGDGRKSFQPIVTGKMKAIQDLVEECSKKATASEYLKCVKRFEIENRAVLDDISVQSRKYTYELSKIESNERDCMRKTLDENKCLAALLDLKECLLDGPKTVFGLNTYYPPTPSLPEMDEDMKENLTKLKNIYSTLRTCKMEEDANVYQTCRKEATDHKELGNYLRKNPVEYFLRLNEMDKAEDTCLRHLAAEYITRTSMMGAELESCLINGRAKASFTEELHDYIFEELGALYASMKKCKSGSDRSATKNCVIEKLSDVEVRYYSILDDKIQEIISILSVDANCMRSALKKLQFSGVFMEDDAKEAFENCFYN